VTPYLGQKVDATIRQLILIFQAETLYAKPLPKMNLQG